MKKFLMLLLFVLVILLGSPQVSVSAPYPLHPLSINCEKPPIVEEIKREKKFGDMQLWKFELKEDGTLILTLRDPKSGTLYTVSGKTDVTGWYFWAKQSTGVTINLAEILKELGITSLKVTDNGGITGLETIKFNKHDVMFIDGKLVITNTCHMGSAGLYTIC